MKTKVLMRLLELRREKKSVSEIAEMLALKEGTVRHYVETNGLGNLKAMNWPTPKQEAELCALYRKGFSMAEIEAMTGWNEYRQRTIFKREGITRPQGHGNVSQRVLRRRIELHREAFRLHGDHGTKKAAEMLGITEGGVLWRVRQYLKLTELPASPSRKKAA